ncbi:hypothetical protein [Massilia sp. 9096]|uniref:hypothetical protein n=1 Tax=Massilia sp. 9096 TaxID=1500894 RepID=UPI0012E08BCE|nr:hypothetical protein [Massilia sp. 9096]
MRPIKIYLDSSDFSKLSDLSKQSPEYAQVRDYLVRQRNEGVINMYFSEVHVLEAAPISPSAIPAAIGRLRTIKELCGKNCVTHPIDVCRNELSEENSLDSVSVVRSDGTWIPSSFDVSEIVPNVEQIIMAELENLSRAARRKYSKSGKPTSHAYTELTQLYNGDIAELAKKLPLSIDAARVFERYMLGKASRNDALKAVQDSVTDLVIFGHWHEREWSAASDLLKHVRKSGENFKSTLLEARRQFDHLITPDSGLGSTLKKSLPSPSQVTKKVMDARIGKIATEVAHSMGIVPRSMIDPWQVAPGTSCSIRLAIQVGHRSVLHSPPRAPSHSDFPDIYQAIYLPYVDIFRADRFMASQLSECNLPFSTAIAENFLQLPLKIREVLEAR